jgi:hypothetical protein
METEPSQLQPGPWVLVQQVNGSGADQPRGDSAYRTTPKPDGHHFDAMSRIRAVIDSLHQIPRSHNRYLEKDLEVIFRDRFLVHAMAKDPIFSNTDPRGDRGAVG